MSSPIAFPPGPSWVIVNADNPVSLPLVGQFDPNLQEQSGKPLWQKKPGLAGGLPWLKYVGQELGHITIEVTFIALSIIDPYPELAWARLKELKSVDETLGRPPRVYFTHGFRLVEGFITQLPDAPIQYWGHGAINSRIVRQIGPVRITITKVPKQPTVLSLGTNYVTKTDDTYFEDLSKLQYGDARYSQSLAIYNQGVLDGEQIELPRKTSGDVSRTTPTSGYLDDSLEGL